MPLVFAVSNGGDVPRYLFTARPDLVVLDVEMPPWTADRFLIGCERHRRT